MHSRDTHFDVRTEDTLDEIRFDGGFEDIPNVHDVWQSYTTHWRNSVSTMHPGTLRNSAKVFCAKVVRRGYLLPDKAHFISH